MTTPDTTLYDLLPALYRTRDGAEVLRALLTVIEEQRQLLSQDLDELYDDWFIETCSDQVVPRLGDLVGHRLPVGYEQALANGQDAAGGVLRAVAPRRDVADAIANRRRKGTLAVLEDLAADAAGLPARAVELRTLVAFDQPVRLFGTNDDELRTRLLRGRYADLRNVDALDRVDGPFDELTHLTDLRQVDSARRRGRPGADEVELYGWRLGSHPVTGAPAYCRDRERNRFTFSVLGNDSPLVVAPVPEPTPSHLAAETNLPVFIRRLAFERALADYYGPGKSVCITVGTDVVPASRIVAADLSGWGYAPQPGTVAVDPVLGRFAFASREAPDGGVQVSYRYGAVADLGGGEYRRPRSVGRVYRCGPGQVDETVEAALGRWSTDKAAQPDARDATIELNGSVAFTERLRIEVGPGDRLTVRAAPGSRPVVRLLDWYADRPDPFGIVATGGEPGEDQPTVTLDGLLVAGRNLRVEGPLGRLTIRDCTLVPGWTLDGDCRCTNPGEASIELDGTSARVEVIRSIIGPVRVIADEVHDEPNRLELSGSVVDAGADDALAVSGEDGRYAAVRLSLQRSTVFGATRVRAVETVQDSIVTGPITALRRQQGCLRFSWIHPDSSDLPQFHCEPATSGEPGRVRPRFTSRTYGTPAYAQLAGHCAVEIARGAEDGSEQGVFHDLYWPQRHDNLDLRVAEFTPAGFPVGVVAVT